MKKIENDKGVFVAPSEKEAGKWAVWVSVPSSDAGWWAMEGEAFATREAAIAEASKCKQFGQKVQDEIDSL